MFIGVGGVFVLIGGKNRFFLALWCLVVGFVWFSAFVFA